MVQVDPVEVDGFREVGRHPKEGREVIDLDPPRPDSVNKGKTRGIEG